MKNKNSKTITIFRAGSFLTRAQGPEIQDYFSDSKKSIGSYFEGVNSVRIASGLSYPEQCLLLPEFIEVNDAHPEFVKKCSEFFNALDTQVPHIGGRTLEIGLTLDNNEPVSKENYPLAPMDFIRYRHIKSHPQVAMNKEAADGNPLMEFYIFDPEELQEKTSKTAKEQDDALKIYLEIKDDDMKVKQMLTNMGVDPRAFLGKNEKVNLVAELRHLSETKPTEFVKVFSSRDLETEYWIKTLVNAQVLKVIGDKYFDAENNKLIGNNLEETMIFFKLDENSDLVITWKSRYQDKKLNNIQKPIKNERNRN